MGTYEEMSEEKTIVVQVTNATRGEAKRLLGQEIPLTQSGDKQGFLQGVSLIVLKGEIETN